MKRNLHNTQFNISSLEQGSDEPIDDIAGCFFIMAISFYKTEVHEINDVRLKQMFMIERDHDAAWGCYKKIINLLYENDGYFVNDCKKIAYFINSPLKRVERIVNDYGLFTYHLQNDIEMISNHSVNANYEKIIEKSVKASESAKKRWENDANAMRTQCGGNAIKERKGKKIKHINVDFSKFWNLYDKKVGDKSKCEKKWVALTDTDRQKIIDTLPLFKSSIRDKQYQPHPETYLNQKRWNDEISIKPESEKIVYEFSSGPDK